MIPGGLAFLTAVDATTDRHLPRVMAFGAGRFFVVYVKANAAGTQFNLSCSVQTVSATLAVTAPSDTVTHTVTGFAIRALDVTPHTATRVLLSWTEKSNSGVTWNVFIGVQNLSGDDATFMNTTLVATRAVAGFDEVSTVIHTDGYAYVAYADKNVGTVFVRKVDVSSGIPTLVGSAASVSGFANPSLMKNLRIHSGPAGLLLTVSYDDDVRIYTLDTTPAFVGSPTVIAVYDPAAPNVWAAKVTADLLLVDGTQGGAATVVRRPGGAWNLFGSSPTGGPVQQVAVPDTGGTRIAVAAVEAARHVRLVDLGDIPNFIDSSASIDTVSAGATDLSGPAIDDDNALGLFVTAQMYGTTRRILAIPFSLVIAERLFILRQRQQGHARQRQQLRGWGRQRQRAG